MNSCEARREGKNPSRAARKLYSYGCSWVFWTVLARCRRVGCEGEVGSDPARRAGAGDQRQTLADEQTSRTDRGAYRRRGHSVGESLRFTTASAVSR